MRAVLLVALAGCGRVAFDGAGSDVGGDRCPTSIGHDEDRDSVDDACDNCPHLPNLDQANADGDEVGDICDPNPAESREHIVLFDTFATNTGAWDYTGTGVIPALQNDSLLADPRFTPFRVHQAGFLTNDRVEIGGHLGASEATHQHQVSVFSRRDLASNDLYFCEFSSLVPHTTGYFALTYSLDQSSGMYMFVQQTGAAVPIENADFRIALDQRGTQVSCSTTWNTTLPTVGGALPAISSGTIGITVQGDVVAIEWVIQIHSD